MTSFQGSLAVRILISFQGFVPEVKVWLCWCLKRGLRIFVLSLSSKRGERSDGKVQVKKSIGGKMA